VINVGRVKPRSRYREKRTGGRTRYVAKIGRVKPRSEDEPLVPRHGDETKGRDTERDKDRRMNPLRDQGRKTNPRCQGIEMRPEVEIPETQHKGPEDELVTLQRSAVRKAKPYKKFASQDMENPWKIHGKSMEIHGKINGAPHIFP
jgi:hypothetical protein